MPLPVANIAPLDPADKRAAAPVKKLCVRCKERKSAILLQTAAFCHECFEFNFEGKVRQGLEQSQLCTHLHRTEEPSASSTAYLCQGRVALGLSGGPSSRALLHIARSRLLPPKARNEHGQSGKVQEVQGVDVFFVDDSAVIMGVEDRTEQVRAIVDEEGGEAAGLSFWPLKLSDVFEDEEAVDCTAEYASVRYLSPSARRAGDKKASLQALFGSIQPSDTPKGTLSNARSRAEDLLSILTSHLLRREAVRRGASCLLTAETSTRMAVRLLDSIGKGRGHKLPIEEGSVRWNGLFLLRPLKGVTAKEVTLYSRGKQLTSLAPLDFVAAQLLPLAGAPSGGAGLDGTNGDKASMARLTESLIRLLEKNVASTVSTVNKVGDKLVFSNDLASHGYDEEEQGAVSAENVGPSVPLRLRKRQDSAATTLSSLSLGTKGTTPGQAGDRSLQGMGLGRMGSTLYIAAKKMVPYQGALACPLCQMPSQRGLHAWKRGLTISSEEVEEVTKASANSSQINLTELLCYACNILLDTPENTRPGSRMALPPFVLHGARRRLREAEEDASGEAGSQASAGSESTRGNGARSTDGAAAGATVPPKDTAAPILHKLDRDQMRRHLDGFLLADDDHTPQRERKQTDW